MLLAILAVLGFFWYLSTLESLKLPDLERRVETLLDETSPPKHKQGGIQAETTKLAADGHADEEIL
jgi:hypothetical protein